MVGTFGAKKYTDRGWKEVNNGIERYLSAMLRHYFKFKNGEDLDNESGLTHLAHMAWNALAVLELYYEIRNKREAGKKFVDTTDFNSISVEESIQRLRELEEEQEENYRKHILDYFKNKE